jgi:hypothetical protein
MLVVLETLSPAERVAFVLNDVLEEIAGVVAPRRNQTTRKPGTVVCKKLLRKTKPITPASETLRAKGILQPCPRQDAISLRAAPERLRRLNLVFPERPKADQMADFSTGRVPHDE